jgi:RHS repeat-associated protein
VIARLPTSRRQILPSAPQPSPTATSPPWRTPATLTCEDTPGVSTLTTYRNYTGDSATSTGAASTVWQVDPDTGQLLYQTYADNSSASYSYNASGQLYQATYGGVTTTYGYTSAGLQDSVTYTQTGAPTIIYTVTAFDSSGHPLSLTESIGGSALVHTFTYDDQGRQTSESASYAGLTGRRYSLGWTYGGSGGSAGQRTGMTVHQENGSGGTLTALSVAYAYDAGGNLSTITGTTATTLGYDADTGARSTVTTSLAEGDLITTYQYNAASGLLESVTTMRGGDLIYEEDLFYTTGSGAAALVARQEITQRVESGGGGGTVTLEHEYICYTYDSLNQVTAMTTYGGVYGGTESHAILASETFAYDSLGNRIDLGYTADNMNRYLTDAQGNSLSYNAQGDLTHTTTWDYTWDSLNRLTFAAPADHNQAAEGFTYDSQNRLTSESTYSWDSQTNAWCVQADQTIQFVYDGWMLVAKVDGATGHILQSYQWDPTKECGVGGLLSETVYGMVNGVWQATATYVPVYDGNANVMGLVDEATGALAGTYTYSAFGGIAGRTWSGAGADPNDILFSSHMYDAGTGLVYMKQRWYAPELGRFLSPDPTGEGADVNRYRYCGNTPVNMVDPTGSIAVPWWGPWAPAALAIGLGIWWGNSYWDNVARSYDEASPNTVATHPAAAGTLQGTFTVLTEEKLFTRRGAATMEPVFEVQYFPSAREAQLAAGGQIVLVQVFHGGGRNEIDVGDDTYWTGLNIHTTTGINPPTPLNVNPALAGAIGGGHSYFDAPELDGKITVMAIARFKPATDPHMAGGPSGADIQLNTITFNWNHIDGSVDVEGTHLVGGGPGGGGSAAGLRNAIADYDWVTALNKWRNAAHYTH